MELNLKINLENKEEAAAQLKIVQESFDELLGVMKMQEKQLKENVEVIGSSETAIRDLTSTSIDLSDTIKNINIVLGSKKDLWAGDELMEELMNKLATFVVSPAAIKLGVLSNAK